MIAIVSTLALMSLLMLIKSRYYPSLGQGYELHRRDSGVRTVVRSGGSRLGVVNPDIQSVFIYDGWVLGKAKSIRERDGFTTPGGYFRLNLVTGAVEEGLSSEQVEEFVIRELGLPDLPLFKELKY